MKKFKYLILVPIGSIIFISYLSFMSSRSHRIILNDVNKKSKNLTFSEIDKMLNDIPNISPTSLPVDIWRVQYLLSENKIELAKKYVKSASNVNPHVYVSEFLQGLIFSKEGKIDSAFYYSKKAFEGWPKNIEHYKSYLNVLEAKQDSISLIKAYSFLDSNLKKVPDYFTRFYASFNKIKLSYLLTSFEDERNIQHSDIVGFTFDRGYNFPNNQVIRDTTFNYTFKSRRLILNELGNEFYYRIKKDSFLFFFKRDTIKPFAKFFSKFSPSNNTFVFRNVKVDDDKLQDQFYIKKQ